MFYKKLSLFMIAACMAFSAQAMGSKNSFSWSDAIKIGSTCFVAGALCMYAGFAKLMKKKECTSKLCDNKRRVLEEENKKIEKEKKEIQEHLSLEQKKEEIEQPKGNHSEELGKEQEAHKKTKEELSRAEKENKIHRTLWGFVYFTKGTLAISSILKDLGMDKEYEAKSVDLNKIKQCVMMTQIVKK